MTEVQAVQLIGLTANVEHQLNELAALRPAEDLWLMVIGCCLLVLVFLQGAKFWRELFSAK